MEHQKNTGRRKKGNLISHHLSQGLSTAGELHDHRPMLAAFIGDLRKILDPAQNMPFTNPFKVGTVPSSPLTAAVREAVMKKTQDTKF